eukprot:scaffold162_cov275-Pinguiococcus_pyrenoidosus.AAC.3
MASPWKVQTPRTTAATALSNLVKDPSLGLSVICALTTLVESSSRRFPPASNARSFGWISNASPPTMLPLVRSSADSQYATWPNPTAKGGDNKVLPPGNDRSVVKFAT